MPDAQGGKPPSDAPCAHCGLPVGRHPVGTNPWFCCRGCETVYHVLQQSGLADTYYRLKSTSTPVGDACPAAEEPNTLLLAELDTEEFLRDHTDSVSGSVRRVRLYLDGVHCAACMWLIERMPFEVDGVRSARLDLPRGMLTLEWDADRISLSRAAAWLHRIGYPVQPRVQSSREAGRAEEKKLLVRVGICWALAGNVMLIAFALYAGLAASDESGLLQGARYLSLTLSIPAVAIGGSVFFRRAWASFRMALSHRSVRNLHMDTPISIGILVGFGYSAASTLAGRGEIWFDSITVLIAALLSARWIQLRSRRLAGDETDRLLALVPTMARAVGAEGKTDMVRATTLRSGDTVEVRPGEVIPVDGRVRAGSSHLDNAVLTGESRPVRVEAGDSVSAGATNLSTTVLLEVLHTGDDTQIGRLLGWMTEAGGRKAPVVLLADRIGGYFVVSVLALGLLTFVAWLSAGTHEAIQHAVALLVITCPCALGMATPLAFAVATGRAARHGIFVKYEAVFETLTHVDAVVIDKTGTLTEGRMQVSDVAGDHEALHLAAAAERDISHPIAQALRAYAEDGNSDVEALENVVGQGVRARIGNRIVEVGRYDWLQPGLAFESEELLQFQTNVASRGATPVCVSVDGQLRAVVSVSDRLRSDAERLTRSLGARGLELYLASGDHDLAVRHVADELGIEPSHTLGRAGPEDKLELVERLLEGGRIVAMIGDGVNDAAALQKSSVGIAVSGSSAAGRLAADAFMTGRSIEAVSSLIAGGGRVMHVVRRNLSISLAYNLLGAGLAMAGVVTPLLAAIAMPVSSFTVVLLSVLQDPFRSRSV
jgi:Cu2+-exporting ATPase